MNIYEKLQAARVKLHSQRIKKTGLNKYSGYDYMELSDFLVPVQTIFNELRLCGIVSFTSEVASLNIFDMDEPEKSILITSPMGRAQLKGCHEVQNIGATETYQRRYLWIAAMEIIEHDALDLSSGEPVDEKTPLPAKHKVEAHKLGKDVTFKKIEIATQDTFEIEEPSFEMSQCTDIKSLQSVFGSAYALAPNTEQKAALKLVYDKRKNELLKGK